MNKAWIREHFNGNDPSMIMWPFFAAQPSPEHDQLKLYLVVHQRSSQHDAGEYKCIIIKPGIKYAAHDAACKKEKYNGEPQADGGKQLLPLLRLLVKKQLRQLNAKIGKQPGKMRGAHRGFGKRGYKGILQAHGKKQAEGNAVAMPAGEPYR